MLLLEPALSIRPAIYFLIDKLTSFQDVANALAGWGTAFPFLDRGRKHMYFYSLIDAR
jgi:hypothetical protein